MTVDGCEEMREAERDARTDTRETRERVESGVFSTPHPQCKNEGAVGELSRRSCVLRMCLAARSANSRWERSDGCVAKRGLTCAAYFSVLLVAVSWMGTRCTYSMEKYEIHACRFYGAQCTNRHSSVPSGNWRAIKDVPRRHEVILTQKAQPHSNETQRRPASQVATGSLPPSL